MPISAFFAQSLLNKSYLHDGRKRLKLLGVYITICCTYSAFRSECGEACKQRRRELDDLKQQRREARKSEEEKALMEAELMQLRQYKEAHNAEVLMSALSTMREKNNHLEQSLSAENRLKQDLFRALGDAKVQVESIQSECLS